ncbi:hypothetical protein ACQEVZ_12550 [Dactylosporangium sp. CA-152071]|uniref:hypothetical protein n=1 Tax=Dactylosporangium sp. CA-152071 TaxID=3239933 RepID=UPI003D93E7DD
MFHEGELSVQERAGVRFEAARLSGMLAPGGLSRGRAGGWRSGPSPRSPAATTTAGSGSRR